MRLSEISDRAVRRINMAPLERLFTDNLRRLIQAIEFYGFKIRIVGGAVRDVLIGLQPRDIDLNSDALPDEIMFILEKHKFPYVTKGIPHGTVKVVFSEDEEYEITSLAFAIEDECCPEKLVVHSSQSWEGDAKRRDFTIDTMSVDLDGHLYDYVEGVKDLRHQFVRFLGDPEERIKKDPVLILRFFKLLAKFNNPKFDKSVLPILAKNMKRIKSLKPKRLMLELSNIRNAPYAEPVLKLMDQLGASEFYPADPEPELHESLQGVHGIITLLFEINAMSVVPAIKLLFPGGVSRVYPGVRGNSHADVFERLGNTFGEAVDSDLGFVDTDTGSYMTRQEALDAIGAGRSEDLKARQQQHAA
jgi:tRNA nucleotidyltransferase/poly(A) polymerase